jgi:PKD repeat protein
MHVSLSVGPSTGVAPLSITFQTNVTGGTPPYSYAVGFGDGGESQNSSGEYTYDSPGSFVAGLVVTDAENQSAVATASINVCCAETNATLPPVALYAFDPQTVQDIISLSGYLRPGDFCYLADGGGNGTAQASTLNAWAKDIHAVEPECVLVAQTARLYSVVRLLNQGLSPLFKWISLMITPSSTNRSAETTYLAELEAFSRLVLPTGFSPATYDTGKQDRGGWNYGEYGEQVDHVVIETQRSCVAHGNTQACLAALADQFQDLGLPTTMLSIQGTVDVDNESQILTSYNESVALGLGYYFLEFNDGDASTLAEILQAMGR